MGFIEQKREADRLAEAEALRISREAEQKQAQLAREQAIHAKFEEQERQQWLKDDEQIIKLLHSLPLFNIRDYLEMVRSVTGARGELSLYTRSSHDVVIQNQTLIETLDKSGINPLIRFSPDSNELNWACNYHKLHPNTTFSGIDIEPMAGFLFPRRIVEPQEPGIGINFAKERWRRGTGRVKLLGRDVGIPDHYNYGYEQEVLIDHVFVRLLLPKDVFVTGTGERYQINSLQVFDNVVEKGFRTMHGKRYTEWTYEYADYGN